MQGIVLLTDSATGRRKAFLLSPHETQSSCVEYAHILAEGEARGRQFEFSSILDLSVAELQLCFIRHAGEYYGKKSKEYDHFFQTIEPLTATYPHKPAKDFGRSDLKIVRQRMISHPQWSRRVINRRIGRIRFIWKWAAEDGLVPPSAWHGLLVVRGIRLGSRTPGRSRIASRFRMMRRPR